MHDAERKQYNDKGESEGLQQQHDEATWLSRPPER